MSPPARAPPRAKELGGHIHEGVAMAKNRSLAPATITANTKICCLSGREEWVAPPDGQACRSKRHGHITLAKVESLVADQRMEWVPGVQAVFRKGVWVEEKVWIPVARFVKAKRWKKTISFEERGAPIATMQLVAGG